jgi:hypothetical protein
VSRFVVPSHPGLAAASGEPASGALDRIVKYVPVEIVGLFTLVFGGLASSSMGGETAQRVGASMIGVFFVGTIAYLIRTAPKGVVLRSHLIVSPLAFIAWAYPISSSLLDDWFIGWIAAVLQGVVLLLALVIAPSE